MEEHKNILLLSLQKNGAAPRDALEFSNALCELKAVHTIVIAHGNELKTQYTNNLYRTVRVIPTFSSSPFSFLFFSLTLFRPLRLLSLIVSLAVRRSSFIIFSTHFHPWLILMPLARFFRHLTLVGRSFGEVRWYHAVHENPFDTKEVRPKTIQWMEQYIFGRADRIVCYSEYMASQLAPYLHHRATTSLKSSPLVLPLGAYVSATSKATAPPAYKKEGRVLVGCLGRIEPYKDIDTLITAFELISSRNLPADLIIAGRGEISDKAQGAIKKLNVRIENKWLGADEMTSIARACDIIVVPYKKASQSGVIALALALGKPVIATNVGGLPEQIDNNISGLIVPPNDPHALAEAIESLVMNPEKRESMGIAARTLGSGRLSWKRAAEIFLKEA